MGMVPRETSSILMATWEFSFLSFSFLPLMAPGMCFILGSQWKDSDSRRIILFPLCHVGSLEGRLLHIIHSFVHSYMHSSNIYFEYSYGWCWAQCWGNIVFEELSVWLYFLDFLKYNFKKSWYVVFSFLLSSVFLVGSHGMQDFSCPTRDQTHGPYSGHMEF